jgi:radical SAM superfamily enzyme YgiQ (UPF0313 family)
MSVRMPKKVYFADLTHTGQAIASNTFPLGVAFVASYAKRKLGNLLETEVFKYPEEFAKAVESNRPDIACFSNFSWNSDLSLSFAKRIKEKYPQTIIVFGGPNYPIVANEQEAFLRENPVIDFYVWLEGEQAFVDLYHALEAADFDVQALKANKTKVAGVHYVGEQGFTRSELGLRLQDLTETPSPYQTGMMDKFFDGILIPMLQTNRGCPFTCTFCTEGAGYYNKVRWSSHDRVEKDLTYISDRVEVPDLIVVDSNFGMYKQDIDICHTIADLQEKKGWPKYLHVSAGKNQKERVLKAAEIVNGAINLSATVQSIDDLVLENIKRRNISLDSLLDMSKEAERLGANSYSEVILCLPGDTRDAHFRSIRAMIDADVNFLRMYQLMLLPGSEMSGEASREKFGFVSRYRVLPRCFGVYELFGESFSVAEIEEICVAHNSMAFEDYLECRALNLSVEIFYNSGIFREIIEFLKLRGLSASEFIERVYSAARNPDSPLFDLFAGFLEENLANLWDSRADLAHFVADPGTVTKYIAGEHGNNELFKYRSLAFFRRQSDLHNVAFGVARDYLLEEDICDDLTAKYLDQLKRYSMLRKDSMLEVERAEKETFDFDFVSLERENFGVEPSEFARSKAVEIEFSHSPEQSELISTYIHQYGTDVVGLGRILIRSHVNKLYRQTGRVGEQSAAPRKLGTYDDQTAGVPATG